MAVTGHPLATRASNEIFARGGNAVDAAVAAGFALAVVEPSMSGLGGRMQMIIRLKDGSVVGVDGTTQAPGTYDQETAPKADFGYAVIGIPGMVRGLTKALTDYGTMTLEEVLKPAIDLAEKGFELLPGESNRHGRAYQDIIQFEATRSIFTKGDTTYSAGEIFIQKELANTLKIISKMGPEAFYSGEIASRIISDNQKNGGVLTEESLENYKALNAEIVSGDYRGFKVYGLGMPAFGGITLEMLNIFQLLYEGGTDNIHWAEKFAIAHSLAYKDRSKLYKDYSISPKLSDPEYARSLVDSLMGSDSLLSDHHRIPDSWLAEQGHTTHLSTADGSGMMVGLTQSLGPNMGSKVVTPGLGFLYASTLGGYLGDFEPGQRASSHISPMILEKDGKPYMVLGAAGGRHIVTAIVQSISRNIDHGMRLDSALAAGRLYSYDTIVQFEMHEESSWFLEDLRKFNLAPIDSIEQRGRFGRVHAIIFDADNMALIGAADPDWEGSASGK